MNDEIAESGGIKTRNNRPVLIIAGFVLLGGALALVLFGGNLFQDTEPQASSGQSLLDQVADLSQLADSSSSSENSGGYLDVGDLARNFSLQDLNGNTVTLADFRGNPVIMNLWATWCAPCRIEMPALQETHEKYHQNGLTILALNQGETDAVARSYFYDEMSLSFTPLLDENSGVAADYGGLNVLPTTYFINQEGIISAIHRGPMTLGQIEGYLAAMMPISS